MMERVVQVVRLVMMMGIIRCDLGGALGVKECRSDASLRSVDNTSACIF